MTTWASHDALHLPEGFGARQPSPKDIEDRLAADFAAIERWAGQILSLGHTHDADTDLTNFSHGTADHTGGAKPHALITGFARGDLAASLTAYQLKRFVGDAATDANAFSFQIPVTMDRPGSIVGIAVYSTLARTAGTATFEVYKNGVATGLTTVLDGTDTQYNAVTQAFGTDTFAAKDRLDVRVTTTDTWTPTGADVEASITVAYD